MVDRSDLWKKGKSFPPLSGAYTSTYLLLPTQHVQLVLTILLCTAWPQRQTLVKTLSPSQTPSRLPGDGTPEHTVRHNHTLRYTGRGKGSLIPSPLVQRIWE